MVLVREFCDDLCRDDAPNVPSLPSTLKTRHEPPTTLPSPEVTERHVIISRKAVYEAYPYFSA